MTKLLPSTRTLDEARKQHGFVDDFNELPPRQTMTYLLADLAAGADLAASVVMSPSSAILVHDVSITPDGTAAGIDGSNTSVWTLSDGTNTLVSKTYDNVTTHPADSVQDSLGTPAFGYIAAGGRLELSVTNGATANTVATVVTIEYSSASEYPSGWKVIAGDEGSLVASDGVGGQVSLTSSDATAADNDEVYLVRARETFKIADDKPLVAEALLQFSEANTDDANVAFGLMDAVAADSILDNGAGMRASFSGACIYKVDGETTWRTIASIGATQNKNTSRTTAGGAAFQDLRIEIQPLTATEAEVVYFVDDAQLVDSTSGLSIKHRITYTGASEMQAFVGVKNGDTNAETVTVDLTACFQKR